MSKLAVLAVAVIILSAVMMATWRSRLSAEPPQKPTIETLKQLEGEFMKAALEHGSAGYMSYYSEDAVELPNGAGAILGKANTAKGMGFLDDKNNRLTWSAAGADIAASGDLGYTWGHYEFLTKEKDGSQKVERGKYMTIWKKQADGNWKVVVDMGNAGPKEN
jgi:ketosteroid isomerase-like protein